MYIVESQFLRKVKKTHVRKTHAKLLKIEITKLIIQLINNDDK